MKKLFTWAAIAALSCTMMSITAHAAEEEDDDDDTGRRIAGLEFESTHAIESIKFLARAVKEGKEELEKLPKLQQKYCEALIEADKATDDSVAEFFSDENLTPVQLCLKLAHEQAVEVPKALLKAAAVLVENGKCPEVRFVQEQNNGSKGQRFLFGCKGIIKPAKTKGPETEPEDVASTDATPAPTDETGRGHKPTIRVQLEPGIAGIPAKHPAFMGNAALSLELWNRKGTSALAVVPFVGLLATGAGQLSYGGAVMALTDATADPSAVDPLPSPMDVGFGLEYLGTRGAYTREMDAGYVRVQLRWWGLSNRVGIILLGGLGFGSAVVHEDERHGLVGHGGLGFVF